MTPQNQIIVHLLQQAKKTLRMEGVNNMHSTSAYICDNIRTGAATSTTGCSDRALCAGAAEVCNEISDRLAPNITLNGWLQRHGYIEYTDILSDEQEEAQFRQVQLYRQRWLDALIAEYSAYPNGDLAR